MKSRTEGLDISRHYLYECFDYQKDTGEVRWKVRPESHFVSKSVALSVNKRNAGVLVGNRAKYKSKAGVSFRVHLFGVNYQLPQLLFYMVTGIWVTLVSTIDGNAANLRFSNLLPLSENQCYWYWKQLRYGQRPHFMKEDRNWRVATKFCQKNFNRYFRQESDAKDFCLKVSETIKMFLYTQDPNNLSDANMYEILGSLYEMEPIR